MIPLIYVAHAFGGDPKNLVKAEQWCAALSEMVDAVFVAPWIPLCKYWINADTSLARGLELDFAAIEQCKFVIMVGGSVSPGMAKERDHAVANGVTVLDYSWISDATWLTDDVASQIRDEVEP